MKLKVMEDILRIKFSIPKLKQDLLNTGEVELVEGNWWKDDFWGVCTEKGQNHLGKILMKLRKEFKENNIQN